MEFRTLTKSNETRSYGGRKEKIYKIRPRDNHNTLCRRGHDELDSS